MQTHVSNVTALHHVQVAIPAGGEAQARAFYRDVLGLDEIEKPTNLQDRGGVWFQTATLQIHLGVDPDFRPATKAHVAYEVSNLEEMRERLVAAGSKVAEDEPLPGYTRFYTADPFGNRVEILSGAERPKM